MFRLCINAVQQRVACVIKSVAIANVSRAYNGFQKISNYRNTLQSVQCPMYPVNKLTNSLIPNSLLSNPKLKEIVNAQCRGVTKWTLSKGKRRTVKAVIRRFYRLDWGIWIRTKAGRSRRLWRKSQNRRRRLRQHVFTNATQSNMLDKMVTSYWKRKKYWVDDPYEPYHTREEFNLTSMKPRNYWKDQ